MYSWDGEYTDCWPYAQAMEGIMETLIFANHPAGEYYAALTKILPISIGGRYIDPERGWTEMLRLEKIIIHTRNNMSRVVTARPS